MINPRLLTALTLSAGVASATSTSTASGGVNLGAGLTTLPGATASSTDGHGSASLLTGLRGTLNVTAAASGTAQP